MILFLFFSNSKSFRVKLYYLKKKHLQYTCLIPLIPFSNYYFLSVKVPFWELNLFNFVGFLRTFNSAQTAQFFAKHASITSLMATTVNKTTFFPTVKRLSTAWTDFANTRGWWRPLMASEGWGCCWIFHWTILMLIGGVAGGCSN